MKTLAFFGIVLACLPPQSDSGKSSAPVNSTLSAVDRTEGLSEEAKIVLATNFSLKLEPGVIARKGDDSVALSTYDGTRIRVTAENRMVRVSSPAVVRLTQAGWDLGTGTPIPAASLSFSRDQQDDTDQNLKSMQEAAKKLKSKNPPPPDNKTAQTKLRTRWLFENNPMPTAELFNTAAIQQLTHLSNIGF